MNEKSKALEWVQAQLKAAPKADIQAEPDTTTSENTTEEWVRAVIEADRFKKAMPSILEGIPNKDRLEEALYSQLDGLEMEEQELFLYSLNEEATEQPPQGLLFLYLHKPLKWEAPEQENTAASSLSEWVEQTYRARLDKVKSIDGYRERKQKAALILKGLGKEEKQALLYDTVDSLSKKER